MGVTNLWSIIDDTSTECRNFEHKTLAIDLSGWICQSMQAVEHIKKPYIRNLFFRVSCLLQHGANMIFVTDGLAPELKNSVIVQRRIARGKTEAESHGSNSNDSLRRNRLQSMVKECKTLLHSIGVPCIESVGEAEALCAYLNLNQIVDGCISDDSDIFLYGAQTVYKDFNIKEKVPCAKEYRMSEIEKQQKLNRQKLVALALLIGCDYGQIGVPKVGKETALKLLHELPQDIDLIERLQNWRKEDETLFPKLDFDLAKKKISHCPLCHHPGTEKKHSKAGCPTCKTSSGCQVGDEPCHCEWHRNIKLKEERGVELSIREKALALPDFPNMEIVHEFLNFENPLPTDPIEWRMPSATDFIDFMSTNLGWTLSECWEKLHPLLARWQIFAKIKGSDKESEFPLKPLKILKTRTYRFLKCYEVEWKSLRMKQEKMDKKKLNKRKDKKGEARKVGNDKLKQLTLDKMFELPKIKAEMQASHIQCSSLEPHPSLQSNPETMLAKKEEKGSIFPSDGDGLFEPILNSSSENILIYINANEKQLFKAEDLCPHVSEMEQVLLNSNEKYSTEDFSQPHVDQREADLSLDLVSSFSGLAIQDTSKDLFPTPESSGSTYPKGLLASPVRINVLSHNQLDTSFDSPLPLAQRLKLKGHYPN